MKSNDMKMTVQQARQEARQKMVEALKNNDSEAYSDAFDQMFEAIAQGVREEYDQKLDDMRESRDTQVLAARGVRQLTSKERDYYQKLAECMKAADVKQALVNADLAMPKTIMNAVFDELQTSHPLLSHIQFLPTGGVVEMLMSQNGQQSALWGKLCDPIVQELLAGFTVVDMTLKKLSAFIPVCKAMLELGPEWLDSFVRQVLYEALANGLEVGCVTGDGKDGPIGMNRQVGEGVSVTDGAYPEKSQIEVDSFDPATIGNLLSMLAVDPAGKPRTLRDVILVVNPQDYYQLVMPATTIMGGDGTYRNNILPYPITIIPSIALTDRGDAIIGIGYKYFAGAGMQREGRIEYSDHYHFLEDERVYLIKLYANGFPMDNNAFLRLNIANLRPATLQVTTLTPPAASDNDDQASLRLGALTLSPAFAAGTTSYTASTTNASNTIMAIPADAGATIEITNTHDTDETDTYSNGAAIKWANGTNTVKVKVTAANGTATQTYTVTVTATLS